MSGGHFYTSYFTLEEVASEIEELIKTNDLNEINEYGDVEGNHFQEDIMDIFSAEVKILQCAAALMHHIDYLQCGDHGEDSFRKRLKEDLEKIPGGMELLEHAIASKDGIDIVKLQETANAAAEKVMGMME